MSEPRYDDAIDQIFLEARSHNEWRDRSVGESTIRYLYDLLKLAPTSANSSPARFVWVRSEEGKKRLGEPHSTITRPRSLPHRSQ
ncbi:nitroreductase family protein [Novosphingobium sp. Rr 2-17]|uniref:nitroreductase family protein n=1 Tax=Novosphingobium sp. Rr 2-17 TaxID=555793 RepID=UPI0002F60BC0